jgi:UDP-glucose 4-epimerase
MLNPYGWSKYAGEQLTLMYGSAFSIPVLSLRLFNVYGKFQPHEGPYALVIGTFLQKLRDGETIVIHGDGKQRRDFVHVSDVADCMLAAAFSTMKDNFYNVGSGSNVSIAELAKYFPVKTEFGPRRFGDAKETLADITETVADLSWSPRISLSQGIQELINDGTPT